MSLAQTCISPQNQQVLNAIGNDYGYDLVLARELQALGAAGDVAIGISTGGQFTGVDGGKMKPLVD